MIYIETLIILEIVCMIGGIPFGYLSMKDSLNYKKRIDRIIDKIKNFIFGWSIPICAFNAALAFGLFVDTIA